MPVSARKRLALGLTAAALGLAACGSDDEGSIPPDDADQLLAQLDEVQAAVQDGECSSAQTDVSQLTGTVNSLPAEVGVETKESLRDLTERLSELTASQCEEPDTDAPVEEEEATTSSTTSTTSSTTTTTTEEEEEAPPEQPDDEGTGLEPGSDNGPPGPEGNPNDEGGEDASGGIGD